MENTLIANSLKIMFILLGFAMAFIVIYTVFVDGLPFRKELLTPWMAATLVDFYINVIVLAAWVLYKESNWIIAIIWVILFVCFGSITTCAYIVLQFMKLSSQESLLDPVYYVLLQHPNRINVEQKKHFSVVAARVVFSALGCLMLGTLVYTCVTDGSPFRKDLLTPWMATTLVDFYVNVLALSVWVAYKESSLISAIFWIIFLVCFGSMATCVYIVQNLLKLTPQDPIYLVLFRSGNRPESRYERTSS